MWICASAHNMRQISESKALQKITLRCIRLPIHSAISQARIPPVYQFDLNFKAPTVRDLFRVALNDLSVMLFFPSASTRPSLSRDYQMWTSGVTFKVVWELQTFPTLGECSVLVCIRMRSAFGRYTPPGAHVCQVSVPEFQTDWRQVYSGACRWKCAREDCVCTTADKIGVSYGSNCIQISRSTLPPTNYRSRKHVTIGTEAPISWPDHDFFWSNQKHLEN